MHYVSRRQASRTRIPMPPLSETFPGNNHRPAGRRPTMREVAAVAGVSLSTVSRAINGDPKVAPDLAEKVRQAVAMLGYRRDITATTLRRADRLSASIGLVFDDVANPFHAMLQRGIEDVARDRGVLAFAGSSDEDAGRERDLVQAFLSRRVDGLIVVPAGSDHGYLVRDRDAGVAVVFVDRPPGFIDADVVLSDHAGGARAAPAPPPPRAGRPRRHAPPARRRPPADRVPRRPAPHPQRDRASPRPHRGARERRRAVRPGARAHGARGQRDGRRRDGRPARARRPADGGLRRAEPHHGRRGVRAPRPRRAARGRARGLRRPAARRRRRPRPDRRRPGRRRSRPRRGRSALRASRRRRRAVAPGRPADDAHPPRVGRDRGERRRTMSSADGTILVGGEALFDVVAPDSEDLKAHPGGGPFNAARTIARLEQPVAYLGRLSTDRFGARLERILVDDRVGLESVVRTEDRTTLALAELGDGGSVSRYRFYARGTSAAGLTSEAALLALPEKVATVFVGTLGLVLEPMASALEAAVDRLSGTHAMVAVDPNCRPHVIGDPAAYRKRLKWILARTHLLKVSEEDVHFLDPDRDPVRATRALLVDGPAVGILTRGGDGAVVVTATDAVEVAPPKIEVADPIGAGDAFAGGFLAWWRERGLGRAALDDLDTVVEAARFACLVAAKAWERPGASPPYRREL